jgi:hypothetical protein
MSTATITNLTLSSCDAVLRDGMPDVADVIFIAELLAGLDTDEIEGDLVRMESLVDFIEGVLSDLSDEALVAPVVRASTAAGLATRAAAAHAAWQAM